MSDYFAHDPDAGPIDYSIDFNAWLSDGDTVSSIAWSSSPTGLTLTDSTVASGVASINVDGGVLGNLYRVTARVTSTNGIVDDRSIVLRCGHQ